MRLTAMDLRRYPIDRPGAPGYRALRERCRADLARSGACVLESFVKPACLAEVVAEIEPHLDHAYFKTKTHSPYLIADDPAFGPNHPRNRKQTTDSATLAFDRIPRDSELYRLYTWPAFQDFLAQVLGYQKLYPYADNLTPVNVLVYNDGCGTAWHFDVATFVVTLLLQSPERGGAFEYAPFIRTAEDENYDAVARVLKHRSDQVRELRQPAGALVIFRGSRTLHRVTPAAGQRPRLAAVFSYSPQAGTVSDAHNRKTFYGRVA